MQDAADFSLRITVVEPERVAASEDQLTTTPFERVVPKADALLPAPRHAWLPPVSHPVPSRLRARSLLGVPPPPAPRASPLSDEDEHRMQRRVRAWRRIAWAQRMLERFGFEAAEPA